jgi:putative redox protein
MKKRVEFKNASGSGLSGWLDLPESNPTGFAVFAHCFTCSKDILAAASTSIALRKLGVVTLRFDFTGLGESEGDFSDTNFSSNLEDLLAAADFLRTQYRAPDLLIGHSWGGTAALACASRIPEVKAVITIGSPHDPEHVRSLLGTGPRSQIENEGSASVEIGGRTFRLKRQFLEDVAEQKMTENLRSLDKPILILHSPTDEVVDIDHARRIFEDARHPKSFVALDGMDHFLVRKSDGEYVAGIVTAWAARYLVSR